MTTLTPPPEFTPDLTAAEVDTLWRQWDVYLRRASLEQDATLRSAQVEASTAHAAAQQDTATAMADAAAAQRELMAALQESAGDGLSEGFVLSLIRIVAKLQETQA